MGPETATAAQATPAKPGPQKTSTMETSRRRRLAAQRAIIAAVGTTAEEIRTALIGAAPP